MKYTFISCLMLIAMRSVSVAEPGSEHFSISTLLSKSTLIVTGKITSIPQEFQGNIAIFDVTGYIKGMTSNRTIQIRKSTVPSCSQVSQIVKDDAARVFFLKPASTPGQWIPVNGAESSLPIETEGDVILLNQVYQANRDKFTDKDILINLFNLVTKDEIKLKLLHDLETSLSSQDALFLSSLLDSGNEAHIVFATIQVGLLKIAFLRTKIEDMLKTSHNMRVKRHCIAGLGYLRDPASLQLILECINDPNIWIRKTAMTAAGFISGNEIIPHLLSQYPREEKTGHRATIIEAFTLLSDKEAARKALLAIRTMETKPVLQRIIDRRLEKL